MCVSPVFFKPVFDKMGIGIYVKQMVKSNKLCEFKITVIKYSVYYSDV